ncbi:Copper chaperone CopZ [Filimonas lacunae]|uniref:Copper chaperone CopZ n=1 Tax=Filimonas lacunae TaxID=477680 RepID=A0A173MQK9_9BACT|nr:heavy-metal-associated domain-containing protein [Filimonas lacunae]BAV09777.1 hypothetical protein FLA_5830 [Filimonas lacunae]SIS78819.1 Copper chaperone CopZ [Filimonas lacunae]
MKKLVFAFALVVLAVVAGSAQEITSVYVKASGLTCSMCSKAIFKALQKQPAVNTVEADIENSGYLITFKPDAVISLDALKDAVLDAGFSVAAMEVKANFANTAIENDSHVKVNNSTFHFMKVQNTTLQGEQKLLVLDKDFLPEKDRKLYASATTMTCFESGKMKNASGQQQRIYHVTMQ